MSLFIKCNIGLPQGCKSCPFNYTDVCIASNRGIDTRAFVHIRHPDCPLSEIPSPHGRLIDAEKLLIALTNDSHGLSAEQVITIMKFPTIIEAEVSE